jgi:hypothetical protein
MSVNKKLSQTLGALKKNYRADNAFESFPVVQVMSLVDAKSATAVHAAVTLASGVTTSVTTAITNPDCYRALSVTGNQAGVAGTVVITGKDRGGKVVTDRIAAADNTTVDGIIPMSEVLKVVFPARVAAGDAISVGISEKLGLYRPIEASADLVLSERKASAASSFTTEANGTISATNGTVIPTGGITAHDSFKFDYLTKIF